MSLLFELNNNRPAYVNKIVSDTLQQTKAQSLDDSDFNSILKKEIISEYLIWEKVVLADKILHTLGTRI
jgi:hypothetical protein